MATPAEGLARLRGAAGSGVLDRLCEHHDIRVLTVFGSAARGDPHARDLDVAVITERGRPLDALALINDLVVLTAVQAVDLTHLNRGGPVIRERALVGSVPLYESSPGAYSAAMTASIGQRIETDPLRRLDLELLAE